MLNNYITVQLFIYQKLWV